MGKVAGFVCAIALSIIRIASGDKDICGSPPDVRGSITPQLKTRDHPLGTAILYNCPIGYAPINICQHVSLCTRNKETGIAEWTVPEITCNRSCSVPFIENGEMGRYETKWRRREGFKKVLAGENVDSRETLILRCNNGALPADNSEILENNRLQVTCNDGTWSKDLQCKQTRCLGEHPPSKNARAVIGSRDHGFVIHYMCATGYATKIQGNVTCHFGSWIGIPPKCLNQPCYTKDLNYPGLVKPPDEHFDTFENFEIHCEKGYRKQARVRKITCQRGKWDISQNPCTFEKNDSMINPTTEEIHISHGGEIEPSVNVESSSPQTTDANRNRECFCTHEFDDSVKLELGNKTVRRSDRIKRGETVSLKCNSESKYLTWQNGFRFYGNASMTCNTCRRWKGEDLPTCSRTSGDTFISYDGELKILPGGIIDQPRGENHRYGCISLVSPPVWNHGDREDVHTRAYQINDRKQNRWFVSYLDIVEAGNKHNGEYKCFIRGDYGNPVGSTNFYLQVHDEEDKSISTSEPGLTSFVSVTQPRLKVETSTRQTSETKRHEDCFCTYEYENPLVEAQIGDRRLKFGDTIKLDESVSFDCTFVGMALKWQNGLRLHGKAQMICSTCKKWQPQDVPSCENYGKSDTIISSNEYLNVLPGGKAIVQKGETLRFSCGSSLRLPEWDYGQRKGVSVTSTSAIGSTSYVSYLDIDKEADELSGQYECYVRDGNGRRSGSTFLHLQVDETGIYCPPVERSGIFTLRYNNQRRVNSTVTFHCKDNRKRIKGRGSLTCLPNGTWSGHYPTCEEYDSCPEFPNSTDMKVTYSNGLSVHSMAVFECSLRSKHLSGSQSSMCQDNGSWSNPFPLCEDSKCSIYNLSMSIPESVELDMSTVTEENVIIGSEVKLKCSERLVLIGDSKAQCGEQGKWKLGNFQCVNGCVLNQDPSSHLIVSPKKDSYRTGDFIYLSCPPGEETSYKVEVIMCMSGRWSDTLPECVAL